MGSCHIRVGDNSAAFSQANTVARSDIVAGGIFPLEPCSGQYFTLRRDGENPAYMDNYSDSAFLMNEIRVYETISLFSEYEGRVYVASDTSNSSLTDSGPQNLITNLQNRSSGNNLRAVKTPAIVAGDVATQISDQTCYKTTNVQLSDSGY